MDSCVTCDEEEEAIARNEYNARQEAARIAAVDKEKTTGFFAKLQAKQKKEKKGKQPRNNGKKAKWKDISTSRSGT